MAKKTAKKTAKKSVKSSTSSGGKSGGKKSAAKSIKKSKPAAKPAKKGAAPAKSGGKSSTAPYPVGHGKGPGPAEIGADLVALFNAGRGEDARKKWYHGSIESIEGHGASMGWRGMEAVEAKNQWWESENEVLGASAEGPYLGATGFAVKFRMDFRTRSTGERKLMEEVGVYVVQDGKIVREEFMYGSTQPIGG